ncbi:MAG: hypothetical protein RI964_282 [Pseudomonadota bacterium]
MCITQSLRVLCLVVCLHSANAVAFKMDFDADPPPTTETPETAMPELFAGTSDPNAAIEDAAPQNPPNISPLLETTRIAVNQAGYLPHEPKRAIVVYPHSQDPVELVIANTNMVLKKLTPMTLQKTKEGVTLQWLDFSSVQIAGQYFLRQGDSQSPTFTIGEDVYDTAVWLLQRSYYLQRCGVVLQDTITHLEHAACHTTQAYYARSDAVNKAEDMHDVTGGWHDAGDFGKYMATATVTVNRLMSLYLMQPARYQDGDLYIPESSNGKPDLLDEVAYELEWMLKMQRMDGAVYRKVSGTQWVSERKPEEDTAQQYIFGTSSPETAKFTSSMALAARVFREVSPADASRYRTAAENAWAWLEKHPVMEVDWQKSDDNGSGKYLSSETDTETSLEFDDDDRLAAAIELYLTTNKTTYRDFIQKNVTDIPYNLFEWKDASSLSLWHLLTFDHSDALLSLRSVVKTRLLDRARQALAQVQQCPLHMANHRFLWGSNKMLAEEGITLLHAWYYTKDPDYFAAALDQVDFLLGRNPFALSFVTSIGEQAVKTPVHLFGTAIQRTIPGLLVGGPNIIGQDNIVPQNQGVMSYVDNPRAYSVNEYAIDYNASLIGLLEILAIYRQSMPAMPLASELQTRLSRTN